MINKPRKPWIAGLLTFTTIGLGHIYSGELKKGITLYFLKHGLLLSTVLLLIFMPPTVIVVIFSVFGGVAFVAYCVIDAIKISKRYKIEYTLKNYNKWYIYLIFSIIALFIIEPIVDTTIKKSAIQAYKIPSGAMIPTLFVGDHILVNKIIYRPRIPFTNIRFLPSLRDPERLDVVVFKYPEDETKNFIMRIIGLPGDTVEIQNKVVYINGEPLLEPYVIHTDPSILPQQFQPRDHLNKTVIPENSYFVMGDNRDQSLDSRFWGVVKKNKLVGKVFMIYWSWNSQSVKVRWDRIGKNIL